MSIMIIMRGNKKELIKERRNRKSAYRLSDKLFNFFVKKKKMKKGKRGGIRLTQ